MANLIIALADEDCNSLMSNANIDEACLDVMSFINDSLSIWAQTEECDECDLLKYGTIEPNGNLSLVLNTTYYSMRLSYSTGVNMSCNVAQSFEEYGKYAWNISSNCSEIIVVDQSDIPYLPIIVAFVIYSTLIILCIIGNCLLHSSWYARISQRNMPFSELESDLGSPSTPDGATTLVRSELQPVKRIKSRLNSLDAFRGLCICVMIFVNYGGGRYSFFKHSPWNGLTIADLIFPWFLWIMGLSMAISLRSRLRSSVNRWQLFLKVLQRAAVLVAVGLILNTSGAKGNSLHTWRLPGVLQRIGVSYFLIAAMETVLMKRQGFFQYGPWLALQDIFESWLQWFIIIALAVVHCIITFMLPVPGCPVGYLGPGGLHNHSAAINCTGGAARYIDALVFREEHMYQHPTCARVYKTTVPFDPEGLLGTLTSVLLVYLGVQAGRIMLCYHYPISRVSRWVAWAIFLGLIAGGLCDFSKNGGIIPVNKNLWSLSFVLATGSLAFFVQIILYLLIDVKHLWSGTPFHYAGMNSIMLFVGHELTRKMFPWSWEPYYKTHAEFLAMNLWGTTLWIIIAYILYRKNIFLTV